MLSKPLVGCQLWFRITDGYFPAHCWLVVKPKPKHEARKKFWPSWKIAFSLRNENIKREFYEIEVLPCKPKGVIWPQGVFCICLCFRELGLKREHVDHLNWCLYRILTSMHQMDPRWQRVQCNCEALAPFGLKAAPVAQIQIYVLFTRTHTLASGPSGKFQFWLQSAGCFTHFSHRTCLCSVSFMMQLISRALATTSSNLFDGQHLLATMEFVVDSKKSQRKIPLIWRDLLWFWSLLSITPFFFLQQQVLFPKLSRTEVIIISSVYRTLQIELRWVHWPIFSQEFIPFSPANMYLWFPGNNKSTYHVDFWYGAYAGNPHGDPHFHRWTWKREEEKNDGISMERASRNQKSVGFSLVLLQQEFRFLNVDKQREVCITSW